MIAPLNVGLLAVAAIETVPVFPEATVIGFKKGTVAPPARVAFAEPEESPRVIVLEVAPKASLVVWPVAVPASILTPLVNVFTPDSINPEVELF